jgi:hypothetical protein
MDVPLQDIQSNQRHIDPSQKPYQFELRMDRMFASSAATERVYKITFNDQWRGLKLGDLQAELGDIYDDVIRDARRGLQDNALGRVVLGSHHRSIETPQSIEQ